MRNILFSPPKSDVLCWCIISIVSTVCFIKSYDGNFVFDDSEAVLNNKDVKPNSPLSNLLWNDFWGNNISSPRSHKSYRPLTVFTFRLNYVAAGEFQPVGFHLVSLTLYTLVCLLLFEVLRSLFLHTSVHISVPWLATLIFAVHPVHAEAVCGIVGRAELLSAFFFLTSLRSYISLCHAKEVGISVFIDWAICILSCVASVLSKEQGITVLGMCSAYDVLLHMRLEQGLFNHLKQKLLQSKSFLFRHAILLITGLVILTGRWWVMGGSAPVFKPVDNPHSFVNNTALRVLNYHYLYALNGWLCLCPLWLCFDWSMGCVPVISSYTDWRLVWPVVFWLILVLIVFKCLQSVTTEFSRCLLFSLSFVIIPFLPASNLLFRVGFVVAERVLFLPSIGVCLLMSAACCYLYHSLPKLRSFISCGLLIMLTLYTVRSVSRSEEWRNEILLFESAQFVCPLNAKVHYNIAKVHADDGNTQKALHEYREAIRLYPEYDQALNNLGNLLKDLKQLTEAESLLQRAIHVRSDFSAAWMNLGIVQAELKKTGSAERSYLTALTHRHKYPDCFYNLGNLYLDMSRHAEALQAWRNATLQQPSHISAWINMLILLDSLEIKSEGEYFYDLYKKMVFPEGNGQAQQQRFDEMSIVADEALRFNPNEASLHYNYANGLGKDGNYVQSEEHYLKALKLQPDTAIYYSNLGVLYHRWRKYDKAERSYRRALELDPGNKSTERNLQNLQKKVSKHRQGSGQ